jgi:hypothetical protein
MSKPLLAIALLAFALRLGYAAASGALRNPQTWEQEQIATNLVERHAFVYEHHSFAYRSYTEPMYPFLAAAVYLVTNHSRTALVLLQLLVASATVLITGHAARLATGDHAVANTSAVLAAIHPGLIRYSSVLHPFVLDAFFLIAAATAVLRYRQKPTALNAVLAALVIGLGALTRPTILLSLAPLMWMAWRSLPSFGRRVRRVMIIAVTAFAVVAPWTIRNAIVHHTFMLTRSGTGFVFWLGHNPATTGSATDAEGRAMMDAAPAELRQRVAAAGDEVTRDRIYTEAAWAYIRSDPVAAIGRMARRLEYFWWFSPQWGRAFSPNAKVVYRAWWAVLLVLIATGVIASRHHPQRHALWFLIVLALLISAVQSIYYGEGRHRLALEPLLMPVAALGVISILRTLRRDDSPASLH